MSFKKNLMIMDGDVLFHSVLTKECLATVVAAVTVPVGGL
jgi:hypothetical protein